MTKHALALLAFSVFPWLSHAQTDFRCKISTVVAAAHLPTQSQAFLNTTYVGKEFTLERRTGQMAGVLKVLSPVNPQIIDPGDKNNSFKMVATMRREQGQGAASAVYTLVINTFEESAVKPFLFTNNAEAYIGTCTAF